MDGFNISRSNGTQHSKLRTGKVVLHVLIQQRNAAPKAIFNMDETILFYNKQQEDNGFKGRKVPRTE
jgi:hypothetical protein